jgi:glycosyltransferase involved in cell wall biosynthesis
MALTAAEPFDIMYLQHPRNVLAYGATRWAKARGIPTVYTWNGPFHDRYLVDDRERPYDEQPKYERIIWTLADVLRRTRRDGRLRDHLRNYWLHWPLIAADALMPISQHEAECVRRAGLTQPQTVVPQWLDFAAIQSTPHRDLDLPHPAILFIGQLSPRKGYDLLLRAMPTVLEQHPTATVLLVSGLNQEDRATLDQMARDLGIAERVQVLGRVEDAELVNLYRAADLYVTPTRYEGFGLTLLEAMTAGCPLISTDIPVVNETVQHGVNGWLTRYNDPDDLARGMLTLLGDEALRQRLIAGGYATITTRFREELLAEQVEDVFYTVLRGGES